MESVKKIARACLIMLTLKPSTFWNTSLVLSRLVKNEARPFDLSKPYLQHMILRLELQALASLNEYRMPVPPLVLVASLRIVIEIPTAACPLLYNPVWQNMASPTKEPGRV